MKHTQGEWKVRSEFDNAYSGNVEVFTEDYGRVCMLADNWSIWNSDKNINAASESKHEAEANAKLIADSPMMFEYILKKANAGDEEAKKIIARHA